LNVDKIPAGDARILEHPYIVGGVHCRECVVGVVEKPGEMLARPCGQAVVVDEDVMAHAHLGDGDLLTFPAWARVCSKSNLTTLYLSTASKSSIVWMEFSTQIGSLVYTTDRLPMDLLWLGTTARTVNCR
jgi:hypothetical protein